MNSPPDTFALREKRIIITRSTDDTPVLLKKIKALGGEPLSYPCIERTPLPAAQKILAQLYPFKQFTDCIFTSPEAVCLFLETGKKETWSFDFLAKINVYAVGPATKKLLEPWNNRIRVPTTYDLDGLLELLEKSLNNHHFLIPRAFHGDPRLIDIILDRHGAVTNIPLYDTQPPEPFLPIPFEGDLILFASPSAVHHFFSINKLPEHTLILAIGPKTERALSQCGVLLIHRAKEATLDSMLEKMIEVLA